MSILEVKNLKKSFGKTEILKGIDFSIEKGDVLSIIGSSGSGKTTLLRCLNFLEFAENGTIAVNQEVVIVNAHEPEKQKKVKVSKLYEFDGLAKTEVSEAARLMGTRQIRRLPVLEAGKICGMVSLGDVSGTENAVNALSQISSNISNRKW